MVISGPTDLEPFNKVGVPESDRRKGELGGLLAVLHSNTIRNMFCGLNMPHFVNGDIGLAAGVLARCQGCQLANFRIAEITPSSEDQVGLPDWDFVMEDVKTIFQGHPSDEWWRLNVWCGSYRFPPRSRNFTPREESPGPDAEENASTLEI